MLEVTRNLIETLGHSDLPAEDRSALTALMLDKVNALPYDNAIVVTPQGVLINGRLVDKEKQAKLAAEASMLAENQLYKLIRDQVRYLAIVEGIHKGLAPEQVLFAKTALWNLQEQDKILIALATFGVNTVN